MLNYVKNRIGVRLFLIFTTVLCVCIFSVVLFSSRYSSNFENLVIAENEQYVQTQALNFLAELTSQRAQKYEAVFQKLTAYSQLIAKQAELRFQSLDQPPPETLNISEYLILHPRNGIFFTDLSAPAMICYWGGPSIPAGVANEISHLAPIAPILADAKMANPEVAASHLILASGFGHYYPNTKDVYLLPPVSDLDLRDTNNFVLANPENNPERKSVWVPVYFDDVGSGLITTVSSPIYAKDGTYLGAAGLDIPISRITQDFMDNDNKSDSQGVAAFLLGSDGGIIFSPIDRLKEFGIETSVDSFVNSLDLLNKSFRDSSLQEVRDLEEKIFSSPSQTSLFTLTGKHYVISSKLLPSVGWRLVTVIPEETFFAPVNRLASTLPAKIEAFRKQFYLVSITFLLASIVLTLFFVKRFLLLPLRQISDAAALIKDGNLDTQLAINRTDEIGSLANTFNVMAEALRQNQKIEQDYAQNLETLVAEQTKELVGQKQALEQTLLVLEKDIERRELVESELILAREAAEAATRVKSNFLATMTHELRTPLVGVLGMNELLLQTTLNEWQEELASKAQESGETLLELISDILDFSKMESDHFSLTCVAVDLPEVVESTTRQFTEKVAAKGLSLVCQIAPEACWQVSADPLRLRQILLNLISNAIKFTSQGEVIVRLDRFEQMGSSGRFTIEVQDSGIGIKLDDQEKIFSPFTRIDIPTKKAFDGTGLGLSIVRRLVEAMDGELGVESYPDKGSLFRVQLTFPLLAALPHEKDHAGDGSEKHAGNLKRLPGAALASLMVQKPLNPRARILVADDYALTHQLVSLFLADENLVVDQAASGIEVLTLAEKTHYDLILMDCNMPDMDGIEATSLLRERGNAAPIVAMSAHVDSRIYEECKRVGMNDNLSKPFRRDHLKTIVDKWLPRAAETL